MIEQGNIQDNSLKELFEFLENKTRTEVSNGVDEDPLRREAFTSFLKARAKDAKFDEIVRLLYINVPALQG